MAQRVRVTRSPGIALKIMSDVVPNEWAVDTRRPTTARHNMRHTYVMDPDTGFVKDVIVGGASTRSVMRNHVSGGTNPMDDITPRRVMVRDTTTGTTFPTVPTAVVPDDYAAAPNTKKIIRVRTTADGDAPLPIYRNADDPSAPGRGRTRREKSVRPVRDMDGRERDTTTATRASNSDVDTFIRTVYGYTGRIDASMRRLARDAMADAVATARYTA